jgi:hypothetical protein
MKHLLLLIGIMVLLTFKVDAQNIEGIGKENPVAVHGGLNMRTMFYNSNGIANRFQPFSYVFSGAAQVDIYGISMPISFILSEQERSFRQPFNQFGMSPTYKWITVHGGYRNISFSPFTLDGYTMLGAGAELRPGRWHLGFMYGRLNRAVTVNQSSGDLQPATFSRKGLAGKIGYGNDTTNIRFSFIKAKDDPRSIDYQDIDSLYLTPAENLALSIGGRVGFLKHFFVEAEAALSLFTKNINSSIELDTAEVEVPGWVNSNMTINASSEVNKAISSGIGYRNKNFGLSLQYRRIDPNYQSMGAYFFQNDVENYTINPLLILWKRKIQLNGSVGIQRDNLSKQKQATAERVISSANASISFSPTLGLNLNYSNYATSQNPIAIKLNDSLRVAQTTQNFSVTPHYILNREAHMHVFTLSFNKMQVDDHSVLSAQRNIKANNSFFNYQITFTKTGLSLFAGLNKTDLTSALVRSGNQGLTLGGGKSLLANKLQLRITNSFLKSRQGDVANMLYTHGLSGNYRAGKRHTFSANLNYINNQGTKETHEKGGYPKYNELRGEVAYNLNF